jgi:hypothetical protein
VKPGNFSPPPVMLSDEEPMAAGGWRISQFSGHEKNEIEVTD